MRIFTRNLLLPAVAIFSLMFSACSSDEVAVTVKTYPVINISPTSGTFRGTVSVSGTDIVQTGVVFSTNAQYPKIRTSKYVSSENPSTDFSVVIDGVDADSTYRYRAFAKTTDSIYYGEISLFKPMAISIPTETVPAGSFKMGATRLADNLYEEKPVHDVTIKAFQIGKYEVTNAQFALFLQSRQVGYSGYTLTVSGYRKYVVIESPNGLYYNYTEKQWMSRAGYENYPVVNVTWYGANEFCQWAGGRLPTEAEWEFAARGGKSDPDYLYSGSNTLADVAWFNASVGKHLQSVGAEGQNDLKLYDMSGNVWEWVADWYDSYSAKAQINPVGLTDKEAEDVKITKKVRRGGSGADTDEVNLRVSARASNVPTACAGSIGFRFAKEIE